MKLGEQALLPSASPTALGGQAEQAHLPHGCRHVDQTPGSDALSELPEAIQPSQPSHTLNQKKSSGE